MSHLSNPLATTKQLCNRISDNSLPPELQDSIRYYTARFTQAASVLLRLPQAVAAQAVVILFRYWLVGDIMKYEFSVSMLVKANQLWNPETTPSTLIEG
jgi:cyclin L